MFYNFSEEARKIISSAKKEMLELRHPYIGTEHLLLGLLINKNNVSSKLKKYNIDYKIIKKEIINIIGEGTNESECFLYTPILKNVLENANDISKEYNIDISPEFLFLGLLEEGEGIAIRILISMGIDLDKLYQEFIFKHTKKGKKKKLYIDEIGVNFTKKAQNNEFDPVIGRDAELKRLIEILTRRNKNNPLLIGEAGVGKTALIEELSRRIVLGDVPSKLVGKRIINIDISSLVAGTKYRGEFEEKVNKIIKEIEEQDDIILFIDEIHTLVGAGGAEGAVDAANILKPSLARNKLHCIGATTIDEYKKYMESDKALDRRFQTILLSEPNEEQVKEIIYKLYPIYEKFHKVSISKDLIDLVIKLSNKYIKNRMNPDKTIDILDEICAHATLKENHNMIRYRELTKELKSVMDIKKQHILNNKFTLAIKYKEKENLLMSEINKLEVELSKIVNNKVTKKDINDVFKMKIDIPIYELGGTKNNKNKLIKELKDKVIGQDLAIAELVNTYINCLNENNCYGLMFSGASGVGKTLLAQSFAKLISNNYIRLDMSEYSEEHSISKLIGTPAGYVGYGDNKNIFESIRTYPFSVLVLDEIERAHPKIVNLFLQILDNNKIKDASGKDIYFNNVIILMTTNIVSKEGLGFKKENNNKELNDYFGISFMNRLTSVIKFKDLNRDDIEKIIAKICHQSFKHLKLKSSEITDIINKSNYLEYGARQLYPLIKKFSQLETVKVK